MTRFDILVMVVVIVITILIIFFLMLNVIEFLHVLRRESTRTHYKIFITLLISFVIFMTVVVADYTRKRMSTEAKIITTFGFLAFVGVFLFLYHCCVDIEFTAEKRRIWPPSPPREDYKRKSTTWTDHEDNIHVHVDTHQNDKFDLPDLTDLPTYDDLYPPPYSQVINANGAKNLV